MKILVIGGRGFFGQKIADALRKLPEADIVIGGRRENETQNTLQINLDDQTEFEKLKAFDFVVNCATVSGSHYKALITWCLVNKVTFIETTADIPSVKLLFAVKAEIAQEIDSKHVNGAFIFGAGIFPGISNLLYKHHLQKYPAKKSIDLNIRYNVLSGAGKGMCRLMTEALVTPCSWFENNKHETKKVPFASLQKRPFKGGSNYSVQLSMPELWFIRAGSKVPTIKTFISFRPTLVTLTSYYLFNPIPYLGFLKKPFLKLLYPGFYLMRGIFLKNAGTDIYMSCQSDSNEVSGVWFNDAFLAAGLFVAAAITLNEYQKKGMYTVEDIFDLEPFVQLMAQIGKNDLKYEYF